MSDNTENEFLEYGNFLTDEPDSPNASFYRWVYQPNNNHNFHVLNINTHGQLERALKDFLNHLPDITKSQENDKRQQQIADYYN